MLKKRLILILKILWCFISFCILCITINAYRKSGSPESVLSGIMSMTILSFPCGYILALLLQILLIVANKVASMNVGTRYFEIIVTWFLFFIVGYLQWFKLLPFTISLFRGQRKDRGRQSQ